MNLKSHRPELLAPAGNLLSAVTALDSGADAVYIGLAKFNARERADNFSVADVSKLLNYAHSTGKKVYITLNTLIKESELEEVAEMLADITELAPDAVIVQDLGVVRMIREFFPSLTIHASTQMGIHNSAGVRMAAGMGIKRVILERQVMTSELQEIIRKASIEIEVFIHGALCCSLSGRCLFSSWLGGWSGNRGKCTQPCRRKFFSDHGEGFFFSTKDLASLETITKLKKMGVFSFKIEGRLKKPDYIRNVVSAYRLMIDADPKNMAEIQVQARDLLKRAAGRQLSAGFSSEKALKELIEPEKMGVTGIYCGKVIANSPNGFTASLVRKIHTGDIIRLQKYAGDDSSALAVSTIMIGSKEVTKAEKGETCFIKCERPVPENAEIYKTGESYRRIPAKLASLPARRKKIDLRILVSPKGFTVSTEYAEWQKPMTIASAEKHPLTPDKVIEAFQSSNSDVFESGYTDVKIEGNLFVPASLLKQTRREFWEFIANQIPDSLFADNRKKILENLRNSLNKHYRLATEARLNFSSEITSKQVRFGIEAVNIENYDGKASEVILPPFCPEDKLTEICNRIRQISSENPGIKFRISSLYAFDMIKKLNKPTIIISFPFPVCNSLTVLEIMSITQNTAKIETVQAWVELEEREIRNLIEHSPIPVEMFIKGQVPLLVTRAEIPVSGKISDSRKAVYVVEKEPTTGITYLYSDLMLDIPHIEGTSSFSTCNSNISSEKNSIFNFQRGYA